MSYRQNTYFESTYEWSKTRLFELKSFDAAKPEAYKAAVDGVKNNFSNRWADEYVNNIQPESTFWRYEYMIRIYADLLLHKISEQMAEQKIKEIENDWIKSDRVSNLMDIFIHDLDNAFEGKGTEFGEVDIPCPACTDGSVHIVRMHTPEHPVHEITMRCGCNKCDFTLMT